MAFTEESVLSTNEVTVIIPSEAGEFYDGGGKYSIPLHTETYDIERFVTIAPHSHANPITISISVYQRQEQHSKLYLLW